MIPGPMPPDLSSRRAAPVLFWAGAFFGSSRKVRFSWRAESPLRRRRPALVPSESAGFGWRSKDCASSASLRSALLRAGFPQPKRPQRSTGELAPFRLISARTQHPTPADVRASSPEGEGPKRPENLPLGRLSAEAGPEGHGRPAGAERVLCFYPLSFR